MPPSGMASDVAVVEDDDEDDEERVLNQRDERLWRNIFAIFDDDGSGAISLEEMGSIMRDLCGCTANHQEIAHVLSLLDENHNGELDFDEFYFFVKKMEKYVAAEDRRPRGSWSEMFDLIDTDVKAARSPSPSSPARCRSEAGARGRRHLRDDEGFRRGRRRRARQGRVRRTGHRVGIFGEEAILESSR